MKLPPSSEPGELAVFMVYLEAEPCLKIQLLLQTTAAWAWAGRGCGGG